jgi:predicted DNA-binding antitoxin AbrB/MazE fold protein
MRTAIEAVYENGMLRPLEPLDLAEHARVRVSVETVENDADRAAWLAQSERRLREVWEKDADDVLPMNCSGFDSKRRASQAKPNVLASAETEDQSHANDGQYHIDYGRGVGDWAGACEGVF